MTKFELASWTEFAGTIQQITDERENRQTKLGRRFENLLFRGHGDSSWSLTTTLERAYPGECRDQDTSLLRYYRRARACKPHVETFTGERWERLPTVPEFEQLVRDSFSKAYWLDMLLMSVEEIYEYLVYLRHHGFPSPLLDWTVSPYVAAFFAFDSAPNDAKQVAVYALLRDSVHGGSSDGHLFTVGPYMRTHKRHLLQQCRYSMCTRIDLDNQEYVFCPHGIGLEDALGPEGEVFLITLPVEQRNAALQNLELMNINPFSLFASEDSLIRTVARRELLFRES
jgi:hypothetical protein